MASDSEPQSSGVYYTTVTTVTDTGLWLREHSLLHIGTQLTAPYEQGILPFYRAAHWAQVSGGGSLPIHTSISAATAGVLLFPVSMEGLGPGVLKVKGIMGLRCPEPSGGVGQIRVPRHKDTIRTVPGKTGARREGAGSQLETRTEGRVPGAGVVWVVSA